MGGLLGYVVAQRSLNLRPSPGLRAATRETGSAITFGAPREAEFVPVGVNDVEISLASCLHRVARTRVTARLTQRARTADELRNFPRSRSRYNQYVLAACRRRRFFRHARIAIGIMQTA
jgi:hypothetical protein